MKIMPLWIRINAVALIAATTVVIGVVTLLFVIKIFWVEQNNTKTLSSINVGEIANAVNEKIIADGNLTRNAIADVKKDVGTFNSNVVTVNGKATDAISKMNERLTDLVGTVCTFDKDVTDSEKRACKAIEELKSQASEIEKKLATPPSPEPPLTVQVAPDSPPARDYVSIVNSQTSPYTPTVQATKQEQVQVVKNTQGNATRRVGPWTVTRIEKGDHSERFSGDRLAEGSVSLNLTAPVKAHVWYDNGYLFSRSWSEEVEVKPGEVIDFHGKAKAVVFYTVDVPFEVCVKSS